MMYSMIKLIKNIYLNPTNNNNINIIKNNNITIKKADSINPLNYTLLYTIKDIITLN